MTATELPVSYRRTLRTVIRYAIVMAFVGLLVGLSFQESAKKLPFDAAPAGIHLESVIQLALVHGHVFVTAVLMPLALIGALLMARGAGGREVSVRGQTWLIRGYLPFVSASLVLHLYKGYHILLMARAGERDFAVIDDAFMGGLHLVRYGVYGLVHTGMAVTLGVFLVLLWRSLPAREAA